MSRPGLSFIEVRPRAAPVVRADRGGLPALMRRGPTDRVVVVRSSAELASVFGEPAPSMLGARAGGQFFDNGGEELVVARVAPPASNPAAGELSLVGVLTPSGGSPARLSLVLTQPGAFGNDVTIRPSLREVHRLGATVSVDGARLTPARPPSSEDVGLPVLLAGRTGGDLVQAWSVLSTIVGGAFVLEAPRPELASTSVVATVYRRAFDVTVSEPGRDDIVVPGIDLSDLTATRVRLEGTLLSIVGAPTFDLAVPDAVTSFAGGSDGLGSDDASLVPAFRRAFDLLDASPDVDISFCPDLWSRILATKGVRALALGVDDAQSLATELVARAAATHERIALLDPPLGGPEGTEPQPVSELVTWRRGLDEALGADRDFGAAYAPWARVVCEIVHRGDDTLLVPPSALIAGALARTSLDRGPWIATAGVALKGAVGASQRLLGTDEDALQDVGINPLRVSSAGVTIQGVRSISYPDRAAWRYITARRLFNYLRRALVPLGLSYVFEPNSIATWIQLRRDVESMLRDLFARGAFAGSRPQDAFFVKADAALNPEDAREGGIMTAQIGVAPAAPLEFLVVTLVREAQQVSIVEGAR